MKFGFYIASFSTDDRLGWILQGAYSSEEKAIEAIRGFENPELFTLIHVKPIAAFERTVKVKMLS